MGTAVLRASHSVSPQDPQTEIFVSVFVFFFFFQKGTGAESIDMATTHKLSICFSC